KFVIIILSFFALWSFPFTFAPVTGGLDSSWAMSLQMAIGKHLAWGSDLIFTYGPLGYLVTVPFDIVNSLWKNIFFYKIISHALLFFVSYLFIIKTQYPLRNTIVFGIISIIAEKLNYVYFPLIGLIYGYFLYFEYSKRIAYIIPLSFASAFLFFTKQDLAIGSLSVMLCFLFLLLFKKRFKESLVIVSSYLLLLFLIWFIILGKINFIEYVSNNLNFITDYASAMSVENGWIGLLPFLIFSWIILFLWIAFSYKTD